MKSEIEVKFFPIDIELIVNRLRNLKAPLVKDRTLMSRVIYGQEKNPQIPGNYLRIRSEGDQTTLSIKINASKDGAISDQKELLVQVDSLENTKELFDSLGLIQTNYQENYRSIWNYRNSEIVIDEWPGLDPYIEIESPSESELQIISQDLGLDWADKTIVSVDELYALKYGLSKQEAISKISVITFEDIPDFNE